MKTSPANLNRQDAKAQRNYDRGVPPTLQYPNWTLYQMLKESVRLQPDAVATLFFGGRLRFGQLLSRVDRLAAALATMGVQKGDRIALLLPNLPGYPIAHFAALKLGAILVPTNPLYVEREIQSQLNDSGAQTVVTLDRLYPKLERSLEKTEVSRVIVMSIADFLPTHLAWIYRLKNRPAFQPDGRAGVFLYSETVKKKQGAAPSPLVEPDDTAILLYTGGTTGVSKGAVLTHRNLMANLCQTRAWLWSMTDGQERILCALPFFHSYGMTTGMHLAVYSRSVMILLPRFDLPEVIKQIRKYRPTVFCGVPSMYNAINRFPGLKSSEVGSICLCISGGAALPADVQSRFEQLTGGKLVEGYGLSETSPVALVNPTHGKRKSGTIGVPVPDTEARLIDQEGNPEVAPGEVGELAIRGPQVMKGYWNRPQETARVLRDGWLHTGDMAVTDEDGFFRIVDRKKDIIISAGMNVYPREVEDVLLQHPAIAEAAVVGVPSELRDEIVQAFVVVEAGQTLSRADVLRHCRERLAKYKIPRRVQFVEELPKSALGKVLKRELRHTSAPLRTT